MHPVLFIIVSVAVAACIGGFTNHLAIKMLFHPKNERFIAGRKIPFTPGLIPKRREEIARSLGEVVGDYLVTSEGLAALLQKPEFRRRLEEKLDRWVTDWTSKEETIEHQALQFWTAEQIELLKIKSILWIKETTDFGIGWMWDRQDQAGLKLGEMIPDWTEQKKQQLLEWVVDYLIGEVKQELRTANGDKLIRQLTQQVMEQTGGLLGTLAGIFMDEDKMSRKVKGIINERIDSPRVKRLITDFLYKKVSEWEEKRLSEVIEAIAQGEGKAWLIEKSEQILKWEEWFEKISQLQINALLGTKREWLRGKIPVITGMFLHVMSSNMKRLVAAVGLPSLVEEQVKQFPIERLEQIILNVSGREFRAITWLGAFLGGMIGLIQSALLVWYL